MPVTTLDPRTALVIVDPQKGIVARVFPSPGGTGKAAEIIALLDR